MNTNVLSRRAILLGGLAALCGTAFAAIRTAPTIQSLLRLDSVTLADGAEVLVSEPIYGGLFRWDATAAFPPDGVLSFATGAGLRRGRWLRDTRDGYDAGWFGASPSATAGRNTAAFAAASEALNRAGGGTLTIGPGVYRVGAQQLARRRGAGRAHLPADIIHIARCTRPVSIRGRGATLKAADGLYFGAFDPVTGAIHRARMPFVDVNFRSDAYVMIMVRGCTSGVAIEGLTLDGNQAGYTLGGEWGDVGRQVTAVGILLDGNKGPVSIVDVRSHDHGQDGIMLVHAGLAPRSPRYPVMLTNVVCDRNGRQGLSWVGGTQLTATRCRFTRTGRGRIGSPPGAGLDIEAEGSICRNGRFVECVFEDNVGVGMVADSGDSSDMAFERCAFVGTTNWSAWPRKPGFGFSDCLFVGAMCNVHGDTDPARATRFYKCQFHSDPARSPTGTVYGQWLADLGAGATNVLFRDCDFRAITSNTALPYTPSDVRYEDCRFSQAGPQPSYPRGIFTGDNRIESVGPVGLEGSRFVGRVTLNGRRLA